MASTNSYSLFTWSFVILWLGWMHLIFVWETSHEGWLSLFEIESQAGWRIPYVFALKNRNKSRLTIDVIVDKVISLLLNQNRKSLNSETVRKLDTSSPPHSRNYEKNRVRVVTRTVAARTRSFIRLILRLGD